MLRKTDAFIATKLAYCFHSVIIAAETSSKDVQEKPAEAAENLKHDELFDAIASLFPDKGLMGAEVHRR